MDHSAVKFPKDYGRRLLPALIDSIAQSDPERPFISLGLTSQPSDGFRDISFAAFARAINRCSWWLEGALGRGKNFPTLFTYLEPYDIRHSILVLAANKTGHKMFFSSPSNSVETHCNLLDQLDCRTFLASLPNSPIAEALLAVRPMRVFELPNSEHLLEDIEVPFYEYNKTFIEARLDPFAVLHSSGTTGVPKLIEYKHGSYASMDSYQILPLLHGQPFHQSLWRGQRIFTSFPWFHGAGLAFLLNLSIFNEFVPVILPSVTKVTASIAHAVHMYGNVDGNHSPPSLLVDLCRNSVFLEQLHTLKHVSYAGGPLPQEAGNLISWGVRLQSSYGSTEALYLAIEDLESQDWQYLRFSPFLNIAFREFGDEMYELVFARDQRLEAFQGVFSTFPELEGFAMKDLFLRHPTKEGLWRPVGRTDDVIVFTDARKLNPTIMESVLESNSHIISALICGNARPQPAVLVEPLIQPKSEEERVELMDHIWKAAKRSMKGAPAGGKLDRNLIILTKPEKPLKRAGGKNTIQRKRSLALYDHEIDQLYASFAKRHASCVG